MRTCVIFNPTAKGDKARRFRRHLDEIASQSTLKLTAGPEDARRLAAEAVREDFEVVVAAGGDGTVNEVLNGIGDAPDGFERVRLGVLPLGTVNVFARELAIPMNLRAAWKVLREDRETRIDLPAVEYSANGSTRRRFFAQMAGAGLDARAVELVQWKMKKRVGPLAYVLAGVQALRRSPSNITAVAGDRAATGVLVLVGNGRFYGGPFHVFQGADLRDGLLEVRVFPRVNWFTLMRCAGPMLLRGRLPASVAEVFQGASLTVTSQAATPLEVDGELIGQLPATFSIERSRLRVVVP